MRFEKTQKVGGVFIKEGKPFFYNILFQRVEINGNTVITR